MALACNLTGAILSLSRTAILLAMLILVAGGVYALRYVWHRTRQDLRFKVLVGFGLILLAIGAFGVAGPRDNPVLREIDSISWATFGQEVFGARMSQVSFAWQLWWEHPWFGVGGGGYWHYACLLQDEATRASWHRGGQQVHHDVVQLLAEHGVVGFGLLLAAVLVLLVPVVRRLRIAHVSQDEGWSEERGLLFRASPVTIFSLAGAGLIFLMSLVDSPFRSPAILVAWCLVLACAPAFLPAKVRGPLSVAAQRMAGSGKGGESQEVPSRGR